MKIPRTMEFTLFFLISILKASTLNRLLRQVDNKPLQNNVKIYFTHVDIELVWFKISVLSKWKRNTRCINMLLWYSRKWN